MADLGYYDDKLLKDDPNAQGGSQTQSPGQSLGSAGTSGVVSSGGAQSNTAGVGAGGQGSWTNIQAYLKANKNDTGSAQSLENKVGGVLGQEKMKLDQSASDTVNQANSQAKTYDDAKANTKEWINKAANAYSWDNQHGDDYRNTVNKVKNLQTQAYQGPQNFTYANSADMSRATDAINNDDAYKNYLTDMYKERTGGQLNAGQAALQNQFDVNNENLAATRGKLATQLAGFDTTRNEAVKNADASIQTAKNQYGNAQAGYNDYLGSLANEYDSSINQQEIDARKAYQNTFTTDKSGMATKYMDPGWNAFNEAESIGPGKYYNQDRARNYGYWGDDLTYEQLQKEKDHSANQTSSYGFSGIQSLINAQNRNASALNKFYGEQDEKYGMTADEDERKYNTLSEILGSLNKKEKGFKVRG